MVFRFLIILLLCSLDTTGQHGSITGDLLYFSRPGRDSIVCVFQNGVKKACDITKDHRYNITSLEPGVYTIGAMFRGRDTWYGVESIEIDADRQDFDRFVRVDLSFISSNDSVYVNTPKGAYKTPMKKLNVLVSD